MELILSLFQAYSAVRELSQAYGSVSDWVISKVNDWSRKVSNDTIGKVIGKLGKVTPAEIRAADARAFAVVQGEISPRQREELIDVLINLTRNVRTRNSMGLMRSSYLRSERLLDQLLSDVEPARRWGEPAAENSPWILQKFLGMGSFGEVWMARNPQLPDRQAPIKFFTRTGFGGMAASRGNPGT